MVKRQRKVKEQMVLGYISHFHYWGCVPISDKAEVFLFIYNEKANPSLGPGKMFYFLHLSEKAL